MFDTNPSILPSEPSLPLRAEGRFTAALRLLRAAVRGEHLDLTQAPVGKALVTLAVPMIMEMVMESIFAMVDVFWVARLLSHHAGLGPSGVFITLGLCFSIFALISVALFRRGSWKRTQV